MQKQESFYYQAQAGALTDTDAVAIGRSPGFWVILLIEGVFMEKKNFYVGGCLIGHFLSKRCVLVFDWPLLPR